MATTSWLESLRLRFSPSLEFVGAAGASVIEARSRSSTRRIVGRALCGFRKFPCAGIPRKSRADFIATQVRKAAPFDSPQWHTAWQGDEALVWFWSGRVATEGARGRVSMMPESLLVGSPLEDGAQLQAMAEGVEGRVWRSFRLVACRWWPAVPTSAEWTSFLRGAGLAPGDVPAPAEAVLRDKPWTVGGGANLGEYGDLLRPRRLAWLMLLPLFVAAWGAGGWGRLHLRANALEDSTAAASIQIEPLLDARQRFDAAMATVALHRQQLRPALPQTETLAQVAAILGERGASLQRWRTIERTTLEVAIESSSSDLAAMVGALEMDGRFKVTSTESLPGGRGVLIKATVQAPAGIAAGNADG